MRILLDHFSKSFGNVKVIEDMNLEIRDGEMLALLGPSGCGKSTTLFAICGIHRVTGGRILFGDKDVSNLVSCCGEALGCREASSATTPVACGVAMDVPQ